jgi:hypothetical protein
MTDRLLYPLRGVGAWVVLGSAVPLWLLLTIIRYLAVQQPAAAFMAVFFLLPVLYLLIGGLLRYALVTVLHTARGHVEPPDVDIPELNPVRLPHVAALTLAATTIAGTVASSAPDSMGRLLLVAGSIVIASPLITLVGLNQGLAGLSLRDGRRLLGALGIESLGLLLVGGTWAALAALIAAPAPNLLYLTAGAYLLILAHHLAGRLLFRHRLALALATETSPEQQHAAEAAAAQGHFRELLVDLHRLCATDRVDEAYARLAAYLAAPDGLEEESVYLALKDFHDPRLRLEHAYHYIGRLAARRERRRAWQVLVEAVSEDRAFRPASDELLISLVNLAEPDQAPVVEAMLDDFERRFPDSHLTANALFRLARARIDDLGNRDAGVALLDRIAREFPQFAGQQRFVDYRSSRR